MNNFSYLMRIGQKSDAGIEGADAAAGCVQSGRLYNLQKHPRSDGEACPGDPTQSAERAAV